MGPTPSPSLGQLLDWVKDKFLGKIKTWLKNLVQYDSKDFKFPTGIETTDKDWVMKIPDFNTIKFRKKEFCLFGLCVDIDYPYGVGWKDGPGVTGIPIPSGVKYTTFTITYPVGIDINQNKKSEKIARDQEANDAEQSWKRCDGSQSAFKAACSVVEVTIVNTVTMVKTTLRINVNKKSFKDNENDFKECTSSEPCPCPDAVSTHVKVPLQSLALALMQYQHM